MKIEIHKGGADHPDLLTCIRPDGSTMQAELPVHAVYHDLAHFVVETELGIREGFWGMIAKGFHLKDYALENETRPFQFTAETYRAEYLATLLQSAMHTGMISPAYVELLRGSAIQNKLPFPELPNQEVLTALITRLQRVGRLWMALPKGEDLRLAFPSGEILSA